MVCPIGGNFSIKEEDQMCQDLKLVWVENFRLLGLDIDRKLSKLQQNYERKFLVVEDIILKWNRRQLTTPRRLSVAKAMLLSQYVYCFTCLDISKNMIKKIQDQLDGFIKGDTKRSWISQDLMYTPKEKGGVGFFNLTDFIDGLRITWVRRYGQGTSDHWCDILDIHLGLNEWNRAKIWKMGDKCFDTIVNSNLHGLSRIMQAYQRMVKAFPEPVEVKTNSRFCQPLFRNSILLTKVQNRNRRGFKMLPVEPEYYGLPPNLTINLNELYEGGVFKNEEALENLIKLNGNINYQIGANTRIALRAVTRYILGDGTHHDGISRPYGNTAPLLHKTPPKYSSSNISNLMGKIKKGARNLGES